MKDFNKYFIVGTNSDALHDTMNGLVIGELIRCKDCKYYLKSDEKCQLIDTRLHFYETDKRWAEDSFCSWAERRKDDRRQNYVV